MKKCKLSLSVLVFLLMVLVGGTTLVSAKTSRTVTISAVSGTVKVDKGTGSTVNGSSGTKLAAGYSVSTSASSSCTLKFDDGSTSKMSANSKVKVNNASSGSLSVSVVSGSMSANVASQSSGNSVQVKGGNSALAVRGTLFVAEYDKDGNFIITMIEGLADLDGNTVSTKEKMVVYDGSLQKQYDKDPLTLESGLSLATMEAVLEHKDELIENGVFTEEELEKLPEMIAQKQAEIALEQEKEKEQEQPPAEEVRYYNEEEPSGGSVGGGGGGSDEPTTYATTFHLNGGSGTAPTVARKVAGATFSLPGGSSMTPPIGKEFASWNTAADGSGTSYFAGSTITMPAHSFDLYAIWRDALYTVTYDVNGGSGLAPSENSKYYGDTFLAVASHSITPPGAKVFDYWNTKADGSGTSYAVGATITMPAENLTLYAQWTDAAASVGTTNYKLLAEAIVMYSDPGDTITVLNDCSISSAYSIGLASGKTLTIPAGKTVTVDGALLIEAGAIVNGAGELISNSSNTFTNWGTVTLGTLTNTATGKTVNTGTITSATLSNSGTLENSGTINLTTLTNGASCNITNSGAIEVTGAFTNSGALNNSTATATFEALSITNASTGTIDNNGTLEAGDFTNSGPMMNLLNMSIDNSFTNEATGTYIGESTASFLAIDFINKAGALVADDGDMTLSSMDNSGSILSSGEMAVEGDFTNSDSGSFTHTNMTDFLNVGNLINEGTVTISSELIAGTVENKSGATLEIASGDFKLLDGFANEGSFVLDGVFQFANAGAWVAFEDGSVLSGTNLLNTFKTAGGGSFLAAYELIGNSFSTQSAPVPMANAQILEVILSDNSRRYFTTLEAALLDSTVGSEENVQVFVRSDLTESNNSILPATWTFTVPRSKYAEFQNSGASISVQGAFIVEPGGAVKAWDIIDVITGGSFTMTGTEELKGDLDVSSQLIVQDGAEFSASDAVLSFGNRLTIHDGGTAEITDCTITALSILHNAQNLTITNTIFPSTFLTLENVTGSLYEPATMTITGGELELSTSSASLFNTGEISFNDVDLTLEGSMLNGSSVAEGHFSFSGGSLTINSTNFYHDNGTLTFDGSAQVNFGSNHLVSSSDGSALIATVTFGSEVTLVYPTAIGDTDDVFFSDEETLLLNEADIVGYTYIFTKSFGSGGDNFAWLRQPIARALGFIPMAQPPEEAPAPENQEDPEQPQPENQDPQTDPELPQPENQEPQTDPEQAPDAPTNSETPNNPENEPNSENPETP